MYSAIHDKNGFYYAIADYIFKNLLFGKDSELTKWFLSKILNIKVDFIEIRNTVFPKETSENKTQNLDIVIIVNKFILLDIEANSEYYDSLHNRNFGYAMILYKRYIVDDDSSKVNKVMLIDFTRGLSKLFTLAKNQSHLQTVTYEKYVQNFETLTFNLDKALEYWYHKDTEMICKYFYLIMLIVNDSELAVLSEFKGISDYDKKYLRTFRKELMKVNAQDLDMRMWQDRYDIYLSDIRAQKRHAAETGRAEGLAEGRIEGIEQNKIENARKMIQNNIPIDLVSKCTGLSLTKIIEIQKSLVNS